MKGGSRNRARRGNAGRKHRAPEHAAGLPGRLRTWWNKPDGWTNKFLVNAVIGILIEVLIVRMFLNQDFPDQMQWLRNVGVDIVTRFKACGDASSSGRVALAVPLVFIDVDERTWASPHWGGGEPAEAPRDGLIGLLDFGLARHVPTLVLDVLIDHAKPTAVDIDFAKNLQAKLTTVEPSAPAASRPTQIVIVRDTTTPVSYLGEETTTFYELPQVRPTPLDALMGADASRVVEAAPMFVQSSIDRELRDWSLWEIVCRRSVSAPQGRVAVLPSVQLTALASSGVAATRPVAPWLRTDRPACPSSTDLAGEAKLRRSLNDEMIEWLTPQPVFSGVKALAQLGPASLANRIVFRTGDTTTEVGRKFDNRSVIRLSALDVLERPQLVSRSLSDDEWRHAVVVIGQSHHAARDSYLTPLGDMPGAMVIINSVDSLARFGIPNESEWLDYVATTASILISAYFVAKLTGLHGFLASLVINIGLAGAALWAIGHGIWVDFMLPLLSMAVVEMADHVKHWYLELSESKEPHAKQHRK